MNATQLKLLFKVYINKVWTTGISKYGNDLTTFSPYFPKTQLPKISTHNHFLCKVVHPVMNVVTNIFHISKAKQASS